MDAPLPAREWLTRWRARIADAWRFGERTPHDLLGLGDLAHRVLVLALVVGLSSIFVAAAQAPGAAVFGRTVRGIARRFAGPVERMPLPQIAQRSVVLDRRGQVIATLAGEEDRIVVPLSKIPPLAQHAVLAIEDAQFYEHNGVDLGGLVRAMVSNVRSGGITQGGSTITQQLVKNTLVGNERSIDRKVREARLAVRLEKELTKRQILEAYLNESYFGNGKYGIGTAAEFYFGRSVEKLTLAQSALLAGIIKAPENYEPLKNPRIARNRRAVVLRRMTSEGMITPAQAARADRASLGAKAHPLPPPKVPYFVEYVKAQILDDRRFGRSREERGKALFQAGLRIETTLDLGMQESARKATEGILDRPDDPASALVSIEPSTGAVRALVGGRDFAKEKYNLAVQGRRQPGSTFKPFTLVAALEAGLSPEYAFDTPSPLETTDQAGRSYEPQNYDERGHGWLTMRRATELSVNTYYVQLIQKVGPSKVVDVAKRMGIRTSLSPITSLALGTIAVSPLELANAYATLASGGIYCRAYAITRITDAQGEEIVRNDPRCDRRLSPKIAAQATDVLYGVPLRGTGRANGRIGRPNAAKTGTTDRYTDSWYAGYTPQLSTVVWLGYAENTRRALRNIHGLEQVFGGSLPAQIWARFMRAAHRGLKVIEFPEPPKIPRSDVPSVLGMSADDAEALLDEEGFSVRIEEQPSKDPAGTVLAQTPEAGDRARSGSLVTLTVSSGEAEPASEPTLSPSKGKKSDD